MSKLQVLDLFSGLGGFSLGLERTGGFETVAFCEIDPFCRKVLAKHWPDVPCHDDITTREFKEGEADVVTGGFPCQDISFAGEGAGLAGSRSGLWRELLRAIRVVRPKYAIVENVAALLSRGLGTVLGDLAEIGYDAEWHCIPASAVGAPHRRDRVWIVADAGSEQHEGRRAPLSGTLAAELSGAYTDPESERCREEGQFRHDEQEEWFTGFCETMADSVCVGRSRSGKPFIAIGQEARGEGKAGDAIHVGIGNHWSIEPDVGRVAYGVPSRAHRLRSLGNAVVPQIPEIIGRAIYASEPA